MRTREPNGVMVHADHNIRIAANIADEKSAGKKRRENVETKKPRSLIDIGPDIEMEAETNSWRVYTFSP